MYTVKQISQERPLDVGEIYTHPLLGRGCRSGV